MPAEFKLKLGFYSFCSIFAPPAAPSERRCKTLKHIIWVSFLSIPHASQLCSISTESKSGRLPLYSGRLTRDNATLNEMGQQISSQAPEKNCLDAELRITDLSLTYPTCSTLPVSLASRPCISKTEHLLSTREDPSVARMKSYQINWRRAAHLTSQTLSHKSNECKSTFPLNSFRQH